MSNIMVELSPSELVRINDALECSLTQLMQVDNLDFLEIGALTVLSRKLRDAYNIAVAPRTASD